jgi:hypothetical protein
MSRATTGTLFHKSKTLNDKYVSTHVHRFFLPPPQDLYLSLIRGPLQGIHLVDCEVKCKALAPLWIWVSVLSAARKMIIVFSLQSTVVCKQWEVQYFISPPQTQIC